MHDGHQNVHFHNKTIFAEDHQSTLFCGPLGFGWGLAVWLRRPVRRACACINRAGRVAPRISHLGPRGCHSARHPRAPQGEHTKSVPKRRPLRSGGGPEKPSVSRGRNAAPPRREHPPAQTIHAPTRLSHFCCPPSMREGGQAFRVSHGIRRESIGQSRVAVPGALVVPSELLPVVCVPPPPCGAPETCSTHKKHCGP